MKLPEPFFSPPALVGICLTASLCLATDEKPVVHLDAPETIHGAVYVSSEAYNAPQMWKNFNAQETLRDFGYAKKIHLNALRVWASYEYWKLDPEKFKTAFDQMLDAADKNGIRILISLFENCGVEPTPQNMWTTDPAKAFAIQSPGLEIASHEDQWDKPRAFLKWFMDNYRNDLRLLAIEVMNEPRRKTDFAFAKSMFGTAKSMQGTAPLTVGNATIGEAGEFIPLGLDAIEFHDNFPQAARNLNKVSRRPWRWEPNTICLCGSPNGNGCVRVERDLAKKKFLTRKPRRIMPLWQRRCRNIQWAVSFGR